MITDTPLSEQVLAIVEDVFIAMVDGEPGGVAPWTGPVPTLVSPLHAWVDARGPADARTVLSAERETCDVLTRRLLSMPDGEEVGEEDLLDAFGEVANVVGGNLKSLVPDSGVLTLPRVSGKAPVPGGTPVLDLALDWQGALVMISLWELKVTEGVEG